MMEYIKQHTKELYFIAAILFMIAYAISKDLIYVVLGCTNILFGVKHKKEK